MNKIDLFCPIAKPLLTVSEVAAILHVSNSLIFRWVREQRLPAVRDRDHQLLRIRPVDFQDFVDKHWAPVNGRIRPPRGKPPIKRRKP